MSTNGNGNGHGVYRWLAGGLAALLGITVSFVVGRISTVEDRLSAISERTTRSEERLESVREQLGEMNGTLKEIKAEQEATNRYLGLRRAADNNPNLRVPPIIDEP